MKKPLVEEWIEKGKQDLIAAKILLKKKRFLDLVLVHIYQAMEKYIKGFLMYNGWKLKKVHDLEELLNEAINYNIFFNNFLDFGRILTASYLESRYPLGQSSAHSRAEVKEIIKKSQEIINKIEEFLKIE